jgi:hypothetical protein
LPASFFSAGALEAGALVAGFFSAAALGGIFGYGSGVICGERKKSCRREEWENGKGRAGG